MSSLPPLRPARPLAAFLAGRQRRRDRERQETLDAAALESQALGDELTGLRIQELRNAPAERRRLADQANRQLASQKASVIPQIAQSDIDGSAKRILVAQVASATTPDELENALQAVNQQLKPSKPLVQITNEGESAATEAFAKDVGTRAAERSGQAAATLQEDVSLNRMLLALNRGAQTGVGEETLLRLKQLGNTVFGLELTEADDEAQVIQKLGNELALRLRNPSSGLGLTGSTSNRDLQFLINSVPGLQRSEEGNRKMIEYSLRLNKMKRGIADEQRRIISENGGVPTDIDSRLLEFANNYEFFSGAERQELAELSGGNVPLTERVLNLGIPDADLTEDERVLRNILTRDNPDSQ